ncbi:MAG TPA: N-(5'-phosphoribosyl)anthranilate isomerase [Lentisphaeria bacterium]|nr:MAG: hypothetical protein A2X48_10130 [Lentisphaerae bacterium GWF2_49_21]HBC88085.1 N-(5'-phosphoribosyl)anthranilate isomerase [Lentisphaeria bacterium]
MTGQGGLFVKICGIIRKEDAVFASECGAAALGFIAYPKSLRFIPVSSAGKIMMEVPGNILKVAVFVNPTSDEVAKYIDAGAGVVQLHGDETAEFAEKTAKSAEVWKAIRPKTKDDVLKFKGFPASKFLIDSSSGNAYGGTGITADWELAKFAVEALGVAVILAGGLSPANVAEAVGQVRPFGIDLSSGVESSPGIKDHAKIRKLFEEIKKT